MDRAAQPAVSNLSVDSLPWYRGPCFRDIAMKGNTWYKYSYNNMDYKILMKYERAARYIMVNRINQIVLCVFKASE